MGEGYDDKVMLLCCLSKKSHLQQHQWQPDSAYFLPQPYLLSQTPNQRAHKMS